MVYKDIPSLQIWKNDTSVLRTRAGGSNITRIDVDLENYHRAFSEMAKRNLLNDLSKKILAWETPHGTTVSMHPNVLAMKAAIALKVKELSPSPYRYKNVMMVGFEIGCATSTKEYFRFTDHDSGDMRGKCHEMMHAISAAQSLVAQSTKDADTTLKIFMAPEFYFRGVNGAYSHDLVSEIVPMMQKLGTGGREFDHWLFVFGTAIAASMDEVTYCSVCGSNPNTVTFASDPLSPNKTKAKCKVNALHPIITGTWGAEVQNVALIQKGQDTHSVVKEYISGLDYKSMKVDVTLGTKKKPEGTINLQVIGPAGGANSRIASTYTDERMGGAVFTMDGITFGMEICLDHSLSAGVGRLTNYANSIQILLIPSFGMTIRHQPCVNGGVIFNVDGQQAGSSNVVVKGSVAIITGKQLAAAKTGGVVKLWGPFPIPRRN